MELDFTGTAAAAADQEESTALNYKQQSPVQLSEISSALDRARKILSSSAGPFQSQTALDSLRSVYELIGSVLSRFDEQNQLVDGDVPMPEAANGFGGGVGEEEESRIAEEVAEGMRECVLQSKRRKRPPSPVWAVKEESSSAGHAVAAATSFDRRKAAFEMVMQFHA